MGGRSFHNVEVPPRICVRRGKAIQESLYGDDQMPVPPTSKPEAVALLVKKWHFAAADCDSAQR